MLRVLNFFLLFNKDVHCTKTEVFHQGFLIFIVALMMVNTENLWLIS